MKKILLGAAALALLASCSGNTNSDATISDITESQSVVPDTIVDVVSESQAQPEAQVNTNAVEAEVKKTDSEKVTKVEDEPNAETVEANLPQIEADIKAIFKGTQNLSKYCTKTCIKKMDKESYDEFGEHNMYSALNLFPSDYTDGGPGDVVSVQAGKDNSVIVTYKVFDQVFKSTLYMIKENDKWKINNYKRNR